MKFVKLLSALLLAFAAPGIAAAQESAAKPGAPKLFVESFTHDFGEVKAGTPLRYTFKVKNEGSADLLIQNVQPG